MYRDGVIVFTDLCNLTCLNVPIVLMPDSRSQMDSDLKVRESMRDPVLTNKK